MNSVAKAKERLKKYPALLVECNETAAEYATCVLKKSNVAKHDCQTEFLKFKHCLKNAAVKHRTRL